MWPGTRPPAGCRVAGSCSRKQTLFWKSVDKIMSTLNKVVLPFEGMPDDAVEEGGAGEVADLLRRLRLEVLGCPAVVETLRVHRVRDLQRSADTEEYLSIVCLYVDNISRV